ncbi:hypothetical protein [Extibacter muris]|uniref:hypothetical protein n=1 Tax=Extibacter muris TaxID=1796622 RepID=UPI001D076E0F|nr:hypothetical protein [Extibacter muris]MCB6203535.1 hypothetical protein [Extibacter muris]MCQ4665085.1 hypothetical protein [Extibacter muris]MCQ4694451.1 hypothetical protein [Extibacter muris]
MAQGNASGYILTKYINDINQENTQVLMEYSVSGAVRQAYTYGDKRVSVDKPDETSYYRNYGRFSLIGLVTEANDLTNSYRYDPYDNLVSGIADVVNY